MWKVFFFDVRILSFFILESFCCRWHNFVCLCLNKWCVSNVCWSSFSFVFVECFKQLYVSNNLWNEQMFNIHLYVCSNKTISICSNNEFKFVNHLFCSNITKEHISLQQTIATTNAKNAKREDSYYEFRNIFLSYVHLGFQNRRIRGVHWIRQ